MLHDPEFFWGEFFMHHFPILSSPPKRILSNQSSLILTQYPQILPPQHRARHEENVINHTPQDAPFLSAQVLVRKLDSSPNLRQSHRVTKGVDGAHSHQTPSSQVQKSGVSSKECGIAELEGAADQRGGGRHAGVREGEFVVVVDVGETKDYGDDEEQSGGGSRGRREEQRDGGGSEEELFCYWAL